MSAQTPASSAFRATDVDRSSSEASGRHLSFGAIWQLVKDSFAAWNADYATSMGAALSYYTLFSIAPLLILVIAIAGIVFGREAVQGQIVEQLRGLMGDQGATAVQGLLVSASRPESTVTATIVGTITLILGATSVCAELQSTLNRIWKVPEQGGAWSYVTARLRGMGLIVTTGFLLLVSLVVGAALAAFSTWWGGFFPGWEAVMQAIDFVVSFAITTALFAAVYRALPSTPIAWRDVWMGACVTALLFTVGKLLIGLYIGHAAVTSGFGAAGSIVIVLVWVYYSSQVFLLGAEFTHTYALRHGSHESQHGDRPNQAGTPPAPRR